MTPDERTAAALESVARSLVIATEQFNVLMTAMSEAFRVIGPALGQVMEALPKAFAERQEPVRCYAGHDVTANIGIYCDRIDGHDGHHHAEGVTWP